jgi:hypothetical protein
VYVIVIVVRMVPSVVSVVPVYVLIVLVEVASWISRKEEQNESALFAFTKSIVIKKSIPSQIATQIERCIVQNRCGYVEIRTKRSSLPTGFRVPIENAFSPERGG